MWVVFFSDNRYTTGLVIELILYDIIYSLSLIIMYKMEWMEIQCQSADQTVKSCNLRKTEKLRGITLWPSTITVLGLLLSHECLPVTEQKLNILAKCISLELHQELIRSCDPDLSNGLLLSMWWIYLLGQDIKFISSKSWLLSLSVMLLSCAAEHAKGL